MTAGAYLAELKHETEPNTFRASHCHKNYNTFYADLTGYDVMHLCVIRETTVKTGARGMPGIWFEPQCSGYLALLLAYAHLINREPGYEAMQTPGTWNYSKSTESTVSKQTSMLLVLRP